MKICKSIIENITEKNPANMCGQTPKSMAIENGHEEIAELIDDAMSSNASVTYLVDGLATLDFNNYLSYYTYL